MPFKHTRSLTVTEEALLDPAKLCQEVPELVFCDIKGELGHAQPLLRICHCDGGGRGASHLHLLCSTSCILHLFLLDLWSNLLIVVDLYGGVCVDDGLHAGPLTVYLSPLTHDNTLNTLITVVYNSLL